MKIMYIFEYNNNLINSAYYFINTIKVNIKYMFTHVVYNYAAVSQADQYTHVRTH